MKIKIVEFNDGTFSVFKKNCFLCGWNKINDLHALFGYYTLQEAMEKANQIKEYHKNSLLKRYGEKQKRVVKVISI